MAQESTNTQEHARLGQRIGAYFIDTIILIVVSAILGGTLMTVAPRSMMLVLQGLIMIIGLGYFIYFEGSTGQTPGKKVMSIRVVSSSNEQISYGTAALRNLLRIIDGLFVYIVGIAAILVTDNNQRIGDLAAKTVVVRTK